MNSRIKLLFASVFLFISGIAYGQMETALLPNDFEMYIRHIEKVKVIAICKPDEFAKGHVEFATRIWRDDYEDTSAQFGGIIAPRESIENLLSLSGITSEDTILLYDHKGGCDAARFWWILNVYGHKNAHILNGSQGDLSKIFGNPSVIEPTEYSFPNGIDSSLYANLDELLAANKRGAFILDARTKEEFEGSILKDGAFKSGRIPNALFYPWTNAINATGDQRLKSKDHLKKKLSEFGLKKDSEIIVYCHSGVRSAHTTLVLTEILGYTNVKNFDGSWIEYSFNKDLPIETGEQVTKSETLDQDEPYTVLQIFLILLASIALFALYRYRLRKRG
ncbi:MAG: sulfurtransferase [Crocinitomicaceae bacterium]|nr:sulfurtransferase [Crocinitomicaceae bacterium]